jgi:hypothetical protein
MNLLVALPFCNMASSIFSQTKSNDIIGVWMTPGKEPAKIQIYKSGGKYFGKIVWLKNVEFKFFQN